MSDLGGFGSFESKLKENDAKAIKKLALAVFVFLLVFATLMFKFENFFANLYNLIMILALPVSGLYIWRKNKKKEKK